MGGSCGRKFGLLCLTTLIFCVAILMPTAVGHSQAKCKLLPVGGAKATAHFSAAGLSDGPLAACGWLKGGLPYTVTHSGAAGFVVDRGKVTTDEKLAYLNFGPLPRPVRAAWVQASWSNKATAAIDTELPFGEAAVLIVADGPFANDFPNGYANAAVHLLFLRDRFTLQKRAAPGPGVTLLSRKFSKPLTDGKLHRLGVLWDGESITVVSPEGERFPVGYDADVVKWWGSYGCVEIVGSTSDRNKVGVHAFNFAF